MFLIIGADGFLGSYVKKNILNMTNEDILCTSILDIDDIKNNRVRWLKIDVANIEDIKKLNEITKNEKDLKVIYLATYFNTKNDLDIQTTKLAFNINVIGLSNFLYYMENISKLYFTSSDMVFSIDSKIKYKENDATLPMNQYGEHKIICEKIVNSFNFNVVRLSVMMGKSISNKKHFVDNIITNIQNGQTMEFFSDVYRTMLDFDSVSRLIIKLINNNEAQKYKIVNISGDESLSKYDMAIKIANKYNLDKNKIIPIEQTNSGIWQEKRANNILLDNSLLKNILNIDTINFEI